LIRGSRGREAWGSDRHAIYPDRSCDILEALLAQILEGEIEATGGVLLHPRRDADAARLGQTLQPRRDVDAVAEDVAILDNDVALMNADAEVETAVLRHSGIARRHSALHSDGTAQCIDDTGELDQ
jgi:hypothetical protein